MMMAMPLTISDYVRLPNAALVRRGVPAHRASFERERRSGHLRAISELWVRSIGLWGGTHSLAQICDLVGTDRSTAHGWAKYRGLRTKTRSFSRTPAQLGVLALATPGPAREVGPKLGVLAVEVCVYRAAAQAMRDELGITFAAILAWTPEQLEHEWEHLGLSRIFDDMAADRPVNFDDADELAAIVDEAARKLDEPSEWAKVIARVRRELPSVDPPDDVAPEVPSHDAGHRVVGTLAPELARDLASIVAEAERQIADEAPR
jgi:hypothetical protein